MGTVNDRVYDAAIVGAGPAGATCAYYLAEAGRRVVLLEKRKFPRDKICGDAVCLSAQLHLERMGVLQELAADGKGFWTGLGGLVSPNGCGVVANAGALAGRALVIAVKRQILDERIARAAERTGAQLIENAAVEGAQHDGQAWTLNASQGGKPLAVRAHMLVAADGALSRLTRALGIPTPPPDAVCSRAYVKAGTHRFTADGVVFYALELVPGYAALFREADGDLNFCCYVIPGGKCTIDDLHRMHHQLLREHPLIAAALGPDAVIERMRAAPLRLGGIAQSYYDHLLIVGDAAGQIDPLTGEGIHLAMDAAELAAITIDEALAKRDLSARFLKRYQDRWRRAFGRDFWWSRLIAQTYTRWPFLLDVSSAALQRQGLDTFVEWGKAMTGQAPKWTFLKPRLMAPIAAEMARRLARRALHRESVASVVAINDKGDSKPFNLAEPFPPAPIAPARSTERPLPL